MVAALRAVSRVGSALSARTLAALLATLALTPLLGSAAAAVAAGLDANAWRALWDEPQLPRALAMTLWTGLLATLVSVALAAVLLSRSFPGARWQRCVSALAPMLAVPHAAFAIGLAFLVAPSGWLLRAFSPWATGFDAPPPWPTTQDPLGLGLVAVLVAKEVPFLLWAAAAQLQRPDLSQRLERDLLQARSMGYAPARAWWRVLWPQLWPRLAGPATVVLAYSLTVVDMALVIGPAAPPTLALLAWQWLLDADASVNAQGAAAAWLLAALMGSIALLALAASRWRGLGRWRQRWTDGRRGRRRAAPWFVSGPVGSGGSGRLAWPRDIGLLTGWGALASLYLVVMLALAVGSVSGVWPFPDLWPHTFSLGAWQSVVASATSLWTTLALALLAGATALVWAVAWLEAAPSAWDARLRQALLVPLVLPSVLWVVGLHRLCLSWGIDAHWTGLWLAHSLAALPYVLIALSPAYLGFDARLARVAATLGQRRGRFLWRVKWPLLKAALWSSFAVGFAVSVAQYLPTLFIGAGRFATVTTEAVTLASGAQRSLSSAYAWLQWLLPALVFGLAGWWGRPRRFAGAQP